MVSYLKLDVCKAVWEVIGRSLASRFTVLLLVSAVCPVAIRAIWFWTICRWLKLVREIIGAHVEQAYSRMGLVIVL